MPVTTLDPKTALVVVDLQNSIRNYVAEDAGGPVFEAAGLLASAFRSHGLPVVLVNVAGGAPGRTETPRRSGLPPEPDALAFIPELGRQPADIVVTKRTWGAFASTDIERRLHALAVTQVVVCGVATSIGVESTARQAYEAGFNVTIATDAVADGNPEAHANSLTRIFPRLGETGTSTQIVALLNGKGGAQ
jgi:nicotinamidase-related amidase